MQTRRSAGAADLAAAAPDAKAKKQKEGDAQRDGMARRVRVLYHYPCIDGVCAALATHLAFRDKPDVDIRFVPHSSFKPLAWENTDLVNEHTEVYLLDYCGPTSFIPDMAKKVKKLTLIDHHKTAVEIVAALREKNQLPSNVEINLEMDFSGASLALKYFNPTIADEALKKKITTIYAYVEDHDLWRHKLPHSKEFASGVASLKLEYSHIANPNIFEQLLKMDPEDLIERGKRTLAEEEAIFVSELAKSVTVSLGPNDQFGRCLGVVTQYPELRSELGNRLAMKSKAAGLRGIGLLAYQEAGMPDLTLYKVSLRSLPEEDTTVISSAFGGGGHKNASSFLLPIAMFNEKWMIK